MKIKIENLLKAMLKADFIIIMLLTFQTVAVAQDPWVIKAEKIDMAHYYGVTMANGILGLVFLSSTFEDFLRSLGGKL